MIQRFLKIEPRLEQNKVLIIYGPRQVGKTTLVNNYLSQAQCKWQFFTGDDLEFANDLAQCNLELIKKMFLKTELLVIDEAQKIKNIGQALKLIVDHIPNIRVIATGSSSFELATATSEALTGRKNVITLYPISILELALEHSEYEITKKFPELMRFGSYPNVLTYPTFQQKMNRITEIKDSYLIKDILDFHKVRNSKTVIDLLKLLAFQLGNEVSTSELGAQLNLDHKTIKRYLDLLEKSFVIYRIDGFSRNLRKEVSKMSKYYFYDLGIRNAIISNFNDFDTRNDLGALWENFCVMERIKRNSYHQDKKNIYFWRTYDQKEIDLIEEFGGQLFGFEFKWKSKKKKAPKDWTNAYPDASYKIISPENAFGFLTKA
ncbi:MAG: ATP-binding protein [Deltaproteobacteria bacterium]|nr:ATP-binding protein [Deltaproteobacteria bacterium]